MTGSQVIVREGVKQDGWEANVINVRIVFFFFSESGFERNESIGIDHFIFSGLIKLCPKSLQYGIYTKF